MPNDLNKQFLEAASSGNLDLVASLLTQGAQIETKDDQGHTALSLSAHEGLVEVMDFLIKKGANINSKSNNGTTPLMSAIDSHDFDAIKLLLDSFVNATDDEGWSALNLAEDQDQLSVAWLLRAYGAQHPHPS